MAHGIAVKIEENYTTDENKDVKSYRVFLTQKVFLDKLRGKLYIKFAQFSSAYNDTLHFTQNSDGVWVIHTTKPSETKVMVEFLDSITKISEDELDNLKKYAGGLVKITGFHTRIYFDSKKLEAKEDLFEEMNTCTHGDIYLDLAADVLISTNRRKDKTKVKEILDTIKAGKVPSTV